MQQFTCRPPKAGALSSCGYAQIGYCATLRATAKGGRARRMGSPQKTYFLWAKTCDSPCYVICLWGKNVRIPLLHYLFVGQKRANPLAALFISEASALLSQTHHSVQKERSPYLLTALISQASGSRRESTARRECTMRYTTEAERNATPERAAYKMRINVYSRSSFRPYDFR